MSTAFSGRRVLVTGAGGFIGSHVVDRLLALGAEVVGLDNFSDSYDPAIKRANLEGARGNEIFELVEGDIRDQAALERAAKDCELVLHFAAMPGVRASLRRPVAFQEVNVVGTTTLLEVCRVGGVRAVVFASSSSVYGNNQKVPFAEGDRVDDPISIYAASKKAGELACHAYSALYDLDVTCLRLFTVFGPRQRPDLAIHRFVHQMRLGRPIPLFGDGSMERDYTYVDDVVRGILAAAATCQGAGFRLFNLGSDRPIRLDRLVQTLESILGKRAAIVRQQTPACEVRRTWADLTLARRALGYEPSTPLEQGLRTFVRWLETVAVDR